MISPDLPPINISQDDNKQDRVDSIKNRSEKVQLKLLELCDKQATNHANLSTLASQISTLDGKNTNKTSKVIKQLAALKEQVSKLEDSAKKIATLQTVLLKEQSTLVQKLEAEINDKLPTFSTTFEEGFTVQQNSKVYPVEISTEKGKAQFDIPDAFYKDFQRSDFRINGVSFALTFNGKETENQKEALTIGAIKKFITTLINAGLDHNEIKYLLRKSDQNFIGAVTVDLVQKLNRSGFSPRPVTEMTRYDVTVKGRGKPISLEATANYNIIQNVEVDFDRHDVNITKITGRIRIDDISKGNAPIEETRTQTINYSPTGGTKKAPSPQNEGLQISR